MCFEIIDTNICPECRTEVKTKPQLVRCIAAAGKRRQPCKELTKPIAGAVTYEVHLCPKRGERWHIERVEAKDGWVVVDDPFANI